MDCLSWLLGQLRPYQVIRREWLGRYSARRIFSLSREAGV
jgi:hypothetical protein